MNQFSAKKPNNQKFIESYPIELLTYLVAKQVNGCFILTYKSLNYFIYLEKGKIIYATNSLEPIERIARHLRRLSHQIPKLNSEVFTSIRLIWEEHHENALKQPQDYQAINWLIKKKYLSQEQASTLIYNIIHEIFETFLLLPKNQKSQLKTKITISPIIVALELNKLVKKCLNNLQNWSDLSPHIKSVYQRPCFFSKSEPTPEQKKISNILRGFNFRQLAAILNQNEISIARKIYPLILNKTIILKEPQSPFDVLPEFSPEFLYNINELLQRVNNIATNNKQWKIICIDDSPTILNEISRFLDRDEFVVFPISESLKALVKIIKIKPDLILLDVCMPNIDGYKICSLVRKYSAFKNTPIIMVTGNKSLIDKAKAKVSGATDYMTKPFTQSDLLDMVFRYLS